MTREDIADALELVVRGSIRPVVTRTFPLEEAERVHELIGDGSMIGRAAQLDQVDGLVAHVPRTGGSLGPVPHPPTQIPRWHGLH